MSTVCAVVGVTIEIVWYVTFFDFQVVEALSIMTKWAYKYDRDGAYFRHLLRAVPARKSLFKFLLIFSYYQNYKFACCLGGFHLRITLNLPKYALFLHTACIPCLYKICHGRSKTLSNFFQRIFLNEHD